MRLTGGRAAALAAFSSGGGSPKSASPQVEFLRRRQAQVSFQIPSTVLDIEPLAINAAASGASLSAFREVMNLSILLLSFSKSSQYEAAGTVWMLDPISDPICDNISISQLENGRALRSQEAF